MSDTTERKLAIAMEALHELRGSQWNWSERREQIYQGALAHIAAEDAPPAPDLAEIGWRKWHERHGLRQYATAPSEEQRKAWMAAYAAMKAADPSCDPMNDPRVMELWNAADQLLTAFAGPRGDHGRGQLSAALAALKRKPSKGENTDGR